MTNVPTDTLIEFDNVDHNKADKIYTDSYTHEFKSSLVKPLIWGDGFGTKPQAQSQWEGLVAQAAKVAAAAEPGCDVRQRIKDLNSGRLILVDMGASVSIWPKSDFENAQLDTKISLQALNGSQLPSSPLINIRYIW